MQDRLSKFCAYCGAPVPCSNGIRETATCRASCTRKLNGLCKKLAEYGRNAAVADAHQNGEFAPHKRDLKDLLWKMLNQPVLSPDRCVREIGDERVISLLFCLFLKQDGCAAMWKGLDRPTYERFVGNGWCEWDEKLYSSLCNMEHEKQSKLP